MDIIKRNGDRVPFDKKKIVRAVENALIDVDKYLYETDTANDIADDIENFYLKHPTYQATVEEVQDMVEDLLMRSERKDVAKSYIRFRYKREVAREVKSDFFDAFGEKLKASNVQNQNANVDEYSFGGRIGEASSVMTKRYALENIVSKMAKENHLNNEIYIHKLNCA